MSREPQLSGCHLLGPEVGTGFDVTFQDPETENICLLWKWGGVSKERVCTGKAQINFLIPLFHQQFVCVDLRKFQFSDISPFSDLKLDLFTLTFSGMSGFPDVSDSKESACNVGDPCWIPGLGQSPGEGNGYPLQHSCLENSMDRGAWWATVHGVAKSRT